MGFFVVETIGYRKSNSQLILSFVSALTAKNDVQDVDTRTSWLLLTTVKVQSRLLANAAGPCLLEERKKRKKRDGKDLAPDSPPITSRSSSNSLQLHRQKVSVRDERWAQKSRNLTNKFLTDLRKKKLDTVPTRKMLISDYEYSFKHFVCSNKDRNWSCHWWPQFEKGKGARDNAKNDADRDC